MRWILLLLLARTQHTKTKQNKVKIKKASLLLYMTYPLAHICIHTNVHNNHLKTSYIYI
jgi:hypothetical protein